MGLHLRAESNFALWGKLQARSCNIDFSFKGSFIWSSEPIKLPFFLYFSSCKQPLFDALTGAVWCAERGCLDP